MGNVSRRTAMGGLATLTLSACAGPGSVARSPTSQPPTPPSSTPQPSPTQIARARMLRSGLEPSATVEPGGKGVLVAVNSQAVVVGTAPATADLAQLAMSFSPTIAQLCGIPQPADTTLVLAPATDAEFDRWTGEATIVDERGVTVLTAHVLPWIAVKSISDARLQQHVLAHEMFHAFTCTAAVRAVQPLWLLEGFAELAAADVNSAALFAARPPSVAHLPTDDQFRADPARSYVLSFLFALFLQGIRRDAIAAFYTPAVSENPVDLNPLVHKVFGADLTELTRRWQAQYPTQISRRAG